MSQVPLSRRRFFALTSSSAAAAALPLAPVRAAAQPNPANLITDVGGLSASIARAFTFQNLMMDAYATGATTRLAQSYSDAALGATAFTYDNAVSIHAYLASGGADNLARAIVLGQGLLYAQAHNFPVADGRFAQAYFVNKPATNGSGAFITPAAAPFYFYGSTVGDQAWAGMALAQLYLRTQTQAFLVSALLVGNWIVNHAYSTTGAGGFSFGTTINQYNQSVPSTNGKSTEHNIDTFAFFTMLATLTGGGSANNGMTWAALAQHARSFVVAMFNAAGPYFYTGTQGDGTTINTAPIPEDCQTWSFMALLDTTFQRTIDWATGHLETTDTALSPHTSITGTDTFRGVVFDTASLTTRADDPNAVWLEGTAHTAAALTARVLNGHDTLPTLLNDIVQAIQLLQDCVHAQAKLGAGQTVGGKAIPTNLGLVAATSVMDTGFGYTYGPSLHIGATGWFLIANHAGNPFKLGYRVVHP